jgi:hypothetical protein
MSNWFTKLTKPPFKYQPPRKVRQKPIAKLVAFNTPDARGEQAPEGLPPPPVSPPPNALEQFKERRREESVLPIAEDPIAETGGTEKIESPRMPSLDQSRDTRSIDEHLDNIIKLSNMLEKTKTGSIGTGMEIMNTIEETMEKLKNIFAGDEKYDRVLNTLNKALSKGSIGMIEEVVATIRELKNRGN